MFSERDNESCNHDGFLLDGVIARHIRRVLDVTAGKIHGPGGAAELLGVNPSTLRNRMNKLGIPYGKNHTGRRVLRKGRYGGSTGGSGRACTND